MVTMAGLIFLKTSLDRGLRPHDFDLPLTDTPA